MENSDVIKAQMAETRSNLSDKLEALEHQIVDTVKGTTAAVTGTIDAVKSTVADTVGTVKDSVTDTVDAVKTSVSDSVEAVKGAFDLRSHVENHPWASVGTAVAVGFVLGKLIPNVPSLPHFGSHAQGYAVPPQAFAPSAKTTVENEGPSWLSTLAEQFAPAIDKLKSLAIGASAGALSELVIDAIPDGMKHEANRILNDVTASLGGTNLRRS